MLPVVMHGTPTLLCRRKDEHTHHGLRNFFFILIGAQNELKLISHETL